MNSDPNGAYILIGLVFWFIIIGILIMQILKRTGFSRVWVLILFVPFVNLVFHWIYAFKRWPVESE
jgi:hypothetical protein